VSDFIQMMTQEARKVFKEGDQIEVDFGEDGTQIGHVRYRDGVPMILVGKMLPGLGCLGIECNFGDLLVRPVGKKTL
jgi:hypothetical protein